MFGHEKACLFCVNKSIRCFYFLKKNDVVWAITVCMTIILWALARLPSICNLFLSLCDLPIFWLGIGFDWLGLKFGQAGFYHWERTRELWMGHWDLKKLLHCKEKRLSPFKPKLWTLWQPPEPEYIIIYIYKRKLRTELYQILIIGLVAAN